MKPEDFMSSTSPLIRISTSRSREMMMNEVIACADRNDMMISLETHNPKNVPFYEHLGFKTFGIVEKPHFQLKQYCMIKEL